MKRSAMLAEIMKVLEAKCVSHEVVADQILTVCEGRGMFPPLSDRFLDMAKKLNLGRDITVRVYDLKWELEEAGKKC